MGPTYKYSRKHLAKQIKLYRIKLFHTYAILHIIIIQILAILYGQMKGIQRRTECRAQSPA